MEALDTSGNKSEVPRSEDFPDGKNHRLIVGNNASDVYEAAKESHFNMSTTRQGEAARVEDLSSQNLPGGENCRPLVGNSAAAAYEAARASHYNSEKANK